MRNLNELERYRLRRKKREYYGKNGDSGNGMFEVFVAGKSFFCIASNGGGWEHVSVSPASKARKSCPTWEEMCAIKDLFFRMDECVVQYHPTRSEYVNNHPYCLHLWRPTGTTEIPRPPMEFV